MMRFHRLLGGPMRLLLLVWLGVALMLMLLLLLALAYLRGNTLAAGADMAQAYAQVVEEQTTRILQATDQRLQLAHIQLGVLNTSGKPTPEAVKALLTDQLQGQAHLEALWLLDSQGRIVGDTQPDTLGINLADRAFFTAHLAGSERSFYVDVPVLSRRTNRWQLSVSRPMRASDGRLEGVIVAALNLGFMDALWRTVDLGPDGSVAMLRRDATLLLRIPFAPEAIGQSFKHHPLFSEHIARLPSGVSADISPVDGIRRIFAFRSTPGLSDTVFVVGTSHAFVLQSWYRVVTVALVLMLCMLVILAGLCRLLGRQWQHSQAAQDRAHSSEQAWRAMFDHSPIAQLLQPPFATIANVNDTFLTLSGYARAELVGQLGSLLGLCVPDDLRAQFLAQLQQNQHINDQELHLRCKDGRQRLVRVSSCEILQDSRVQHLYSLVDITERRQTLEQARISQRALAEISEGVLIADAQRKTLSVNRAFEVLTGFSEADLVGRSCAALQGPLTDQLTLARLRTQLNAGEPVHCELLNYRKDGSLFWNELSINPVRNPAGVVTHFVGIQRDITQRKAYALQLSLTEQVFAQGKEGITLTDAKGLIVKVNQAFTDITGYSEAEVLGKNPRILASGLQDRAFYQAMWTAILTQGHWSGEIFNRAKDGTIYPEWLTISVIRDGQGQVSHFLGSFSDLSQTKAAESRIQSLSHFDPLTGLANRALLQDRTAQAISMVQRAKEPLCMMLISLDHFKAINDTLGHHVGDLLLIEVGKRLSASVRDQDTVAHPSGKEFVLVLPGTTPEGAAYLAGELLWALAQPHQVAGQTLEMTVSIGLASYPDNGDNFESLFKSVEIALHQAQLDGRDNYRFFSNDVYQQVLARDSLVKALRCAAERGELQVHYQPLADLQTGKICGMEALLRWHHPERGNISPAVFIPLAEDCGLIKSIGEWVLRQVCEDLRRWLDAGLEVPHVAVNVSPLQFRDAGFVALVQLVLAEKAVPPELIHLEVTESALMDDADRCEAVLRELKALGFSLSLDDFGTGYSSLSYLKRYPFDKVKIDQSFVRDIGSSRTDTVIVKVIIAMAHGLGLKVIAEGVETEVQCEIMRSHVCDEIQGYFFSRPVNAAALETLLRATHQLPPHLLRFRAQQRTLLLVDDEPNVVAAIKRLLRRDGCTILSANSGAEGLAVLAQHKVNVIISDQRMPGMSGVEFLREAKQRYPDTIRIVLSGYTELQSVTDAINEGAIYRFLTKPWEDAQLRDQITQAFKHQALLEQNQQLDIKVHAANKELISANRQLGDVIAATRKQLDADAVNLAMLQEAVRQVQTPLLWLDEKAVIALANDAAEILFLDQGPLLGAALADAIPALLPVSVGPEHISDVWLSGRCYRVSCHLMDQRSRAKGRLLMLIAMDTHAMTAVQLSDSLPNATKADWVAMSKEVLTCPT